MSPMFHNDSLKYHRKFTRVKTSVSYHFLVYGDYKKAQNTVSY